MACGVFKKLFAACIAIAPFFFLLAPAKVKAETYRYNMSYIYFGAPSSYLYSVESTKNSIDDISPNYFDLNDDGTLKLADVVDASFVEDMHERNVKVTPFLSNHWNREQGRAALANRDMLAQQVADAVERLGVDGVNIDIENLTPEDRACYVDFVRLVREKLPDEKSVAVAVAPNPFWTTEGWQGSYDYASLGAYADYLMIMAYDQSYQGGPQGPVASASFVENSIKYALQFVPKEKVVLGIPFYGRYWKNGSSYGGYGISLDDVERLVNQYGGKVSYDWTAQSAKAVITIKKTDSKPYIYGRQLTAGTYTIWYENEASIKYKLKLVDKYDLKGTGSWSLGQETKKTWDYYKLWLNGFYFNDAQGHWALDSILSMAVKSWMRGVSSTSFLPDNSLTRAEASVIIARALKLDGSDGEGIFSDISGHWAEKEINAVAQHGIILGKGDGTFAPDDPVTRQEIAVMLDRALTALNAPGDTESYYWDISPERNSWSYDSIMKLTYYNILTGRPDKAFYPDNGATRAEMAAIMDRAAMYIDAQFFK